MRASSRDSGRGPGFHLMEQGRQLGDPNPADQDRYVLLESLLSARQHLVITWSSRDNRSGEALMPCTPVRQWLALLEQDLGTAAMAQLLWEPAANPLERRNFIAAGPLPPICSDRRLLQVRRLLEEQRPEAPRPLAAAAGVLPAACAAPQPSHGDLLAWLQAPQASWLDSLGLRPKEWGLQMRDRESLSLEERQRAQLLRDTLDRQTLPDWAQEQRGRGLLPAGAAGELENRQLRQRWCSLQAVLNELGDQDLVTATAVGLEAMLPLRGGRVVLAHGARPRPAQRLELWLGLLLASAGGLAPSGGLLVGRDDHSFRVLEQLEPLTAGQAVVQLEQLLNLRDRYRHRCWPVPPGSGWAWATAERRRPGSGFQAARTEWEGGFGSSAEREEAVMALCFGRSTSTRDLLDADFSEAAQTLLTPLLERHSLVRTRSRSR